MVDVGVDGNVLLCVYSDMPSPFEGKSSIWTMGLAVSLGASPVRNRL